jgi:chemotaxis protein MotB
MSKRGGHGGAWKVAYADFVTAMMALFMVLWIVASSQEIKEGIAGYFRSTALIQQKSNAIGVLAPITQVSRAPRQTPTTFDNSSDAGWDPDVAVRAGGDPSSITSDSEVAESESKGEMQGGTGTKYSYRILAAQESLRETQQNLATTLHKLLARNNREMSENDQFRFEFMNDGFRIQALDKSDRPLFEPNNASLTPYGQEVLKKISWEMERFPYRLEIEGHTARPKENSTDGDSLNNQWDLSTRRAMSAQQFIYELGMMDSSQFFRVTGYADRQPLNAEEPNDPANRRITLTFRLDPDADFDKVRQAFSPKN